MTRVRLIFLTTVFLIPSLAFASELILKSGQKIDGKIVEQTSKYVKIDAGVGVAITYYDDEIETIDGQKIQTPPPPAPVIVPVTQPSEVIPLTQSVKAIPQQPISQTYVPSTQGDASDQKASEEIPAPIVKDQEEGADIPDTFVVKVDQFQHTFQYTYTKTTEYKDKGLVIGLQLFPPSQVYLNDVASNGWLLDLYPVQKAKELKDKYNLPDYDSVALCQGPARNELEASVEHLQLFAANENIGNDIKEITQTYTDGLQGGGHRLYVEVKGYKLSLDKVVILQNGSEQPVNVQDNAPIGFIVTDIKLIQQEALDIDESSDQQVSNVTPLNVISSSSVSKPDVMSQALPQQATINTQQENSYSLVGTWKKNCSEKTNGLSIDKAADGRYSLSVCSSDGMCIKFAASSIINDKNYEVIDENTIGLLKGEGKYEIYHRCEGQAIKSNPFSWWKNIGWCIFGLFYYIGYALGLIRLAKKCDVAHSWLAWVPFADFYVKCRIGGKPWWWGVILLPLQIWISSLASHGLSYFFLIMIIAITLACMDIKVWTGILRNCNKTVWLILLNIFPGPIALVWYLATRKD